MLVLSRKRGETIIVTSEYGERIVITLVETRGEKARIGIDAPRSCAVNRGEIQELVEKGYK